jgi:twitching motility protein PilJ
MLGGILALLLAGSAALLYFDSPQSSPADSHALFGRVVAAAQSANALAATALAGTAGAVGELATQKNQILDGWRSATESGAARASLGTLVAAQTEIDEIADAIDALGVTAESLARVDAATDRLQRLSPQLLASARSLFSQLNAQDLAADGPYLEWLEQSVESLQATLANRSPTQPPSDFLASIKRNEASIGSIIRGITGNSDRLRIRAAVGQADPVDVETTLRLLNEVDLAAEAIGGEEPQLLAAAEANARIERAAMALTQRYQNARPPAVTGERSYTLVLAMLAAALVVLALLMVAFVRARKDSQTADVHAEQNERNQQAILRLLDELSNLADGDLTVRATVTEDITGAIADSINYAIEALRELVVTIKDSAILVDAAAKQSEATAHHMVRASETQARQAVAATNAIAQLNQSVEEVAGNAERCSDVARHAVEVSHKGGEAVRRTIDGMNTIRETIQDTSKRIKRLGESSQEIGNIVELIEEIAEQTNILALNASIEASRAGEASRGFAVVADEVQKLAERSTTATRKIEVLVSTIQSDTNEAVVSMERSTTDVVGGALLAENAGAALDEIEQVSHQIASLVQNISGSAREQTRAAATISHNMDVLREVSKNAKQSTTATSSAISKLSELASQLRRTVSGFILPEKDAATGMFSRSQGGATFTAPEASIGRDIEPHNTERQEAVGQHR